jgi:hypothetical protein
MYLVQLYRHNRAAAIIVSALLFGFIYLNYKWGLVATPLLQYGMYSHPVSVQEERVVYRITDENGVDLLAKLDYHQRDQVFFYLGHTGYLSSNLHVYQTFEPLLRPFQLQHTSEKFGLNPDAEEELNHWMINRMVEQVGVTGPTPEKIRIYRTNAVWRNHKLQYTGGEQLLFHND